MLHVIGETARHAGQVDIAGELLDGGIGLGRADRRAGRPLTHDDLGHRVTFGLCDPDGVAGAGRYGGEVALRG